MSEKKSLISPVQILSALFLSVTVLLLTHFTGLKIFESRFLDLSFQIRGPETPHPDIVIVEINDESLRLLGTWPWPRGYHAQLLKVLKQDKPRSVFFDMMFYEPSRHDQDEAFTEAIKAVDNVILSYHFNSESSERMTEPAALPIEPLKNAAKGIGYVNIFPDSDGHTRHITLTHRFRGQEYSHVSWAIAQEYFRQKNLPLPKFDLTEEMLINFPGPYHSFKIIPYQYITGTYGRPEWKGLHDSLKNKIILVGHTATGTGIDLKSTVFSSIYPGAGVLASMLHTILSNNWIRPLPWWVHFLLLFPFTLLIVYITQTVTPLRGFLFTGASLTISFLISQVTFKYFLLWIPFGAFLISASIIYLTLTLISFVKIHFEREILARELSLASRIQKSLLPTEVPDIQGIQLSAFTLPARHVGGDLYDLISLPDGKCGICIGDVSGKGVPAALFMARCLSEFRRETSAFDPATVVTNVNKKLTEGGFNGLFVTLLYLVIDPANKKMSFANGGHEPIFHYQKKTGKVALLKTELGGPLGIDGEGVFDLKEATIESGDFILLESDGLKEAMNSKKEIFDFQRIEAAMIEAAKKSPDEIIQHVNLRVNEFVKDAPQHDDLTIVCAKFI